MLLIEQLNTQKPISAIYFDGNKKTFFVKRFLVDNKTIKFNSSDVYWRFKFNPERG